MLGFKKKIRSLIGIDIAGSSVRLMEMGWKNQEYFLIAAACAPVLYSASNSENDISQAIQSALSLANFQSQTAAMALKDENVITKNIYLDNLLSEEEIWQQVQFIATQYFQSSSQAISLDYVKLGVAPHQPKLQEIKWYAAKQKDINQFITILHTAKLRPAFIETESTALSHAATIIKNGAAPELHGLFTEENAASIGLHWQEYNPEDFMLSHALSLRVSEI